MSGTDVPKSACNLCRHRKVGTRTHRGSSSQMLYADHIIVSLDPLRQGQACVRKLSIGQGSVCLYTLTSAQKRPRVSLHRVYNQLLLLIMVL